MGIIIFLAGAGAVTWLEESSSFAHATPHQRLMAGLIVGVPFLLAALRSESRKKSAAKKKSAPRTGYPYGGR